MDQEKQRWLLKIDLSELEYAMENASWEHSYYLDRETGNMLLVAEETRRQLEELMGEVDKIKAGEEEQDLESALSQADLPDWQKNALRDANEVEEGFGTRYISIPNADSGEAYNDMEDLIETVRDQRLQEQLWCAINGSHPFRRFKDVLVDNSIERERWFSLKNSRIHERALEWLEEEGIELPGAG